MIMGTIQYSSRYSGLGKGVQTALEFLSRRKWLELPLGEHVVEPGLVYLELAEKTTTPSDTGLFQVHKKHIEIYTTEEGGDWYGYASIDNLNPVGTYDPHTDLAFYEGQGIYLQVPKGQFVLFFPEDAHKPWASFGGEKPRTLKTLTLKVMVEPGVKTGVLGGFE